MVRSKMPEQRKGKQTAPTEEHTQGTTPPASQATSHPPEPSSTPNRGLTPPAAVVVEEKRHRRRKQREKNEGKDSPRGSVTQEVSSSPRVVTTTPPSPSEAAPRHEENNNNNTNSGTAAPMDCPAINFFDGDVTPDMRATASAFSRSAASTPRARTLSPGNPAGHSPSQRQDQSPAPHHHAGGESATATATATSTYTHTRTGPQPTPSPSRKNSSSLPDHRHHRHRHDVGDDHLTASERGSRQRHSSSSSPLGAVPHEEQHHKHERKENLDNNNKKNKKKKKENEYNKTKKRTSTSTSSSTSGSFAPSLPYNRGTHGPQLFSSSPTPTPMALCTPAARATTTEMVVRGRRGHSAAGHSTSPSPSPSLFHASSSPPPGRTSASPGPRFHSVRPDGCVLESSRPATAASEGQEYSGSDGSERITRSTTTTTTTAADHHHHTNKRDRNRKAKEKANRRSVLHVEEIEEGASIDAATWRSDSYVAVRRRRRSSVEWHTTALEAVRDRHEVQFIEPRNPATYVAKSSFCAQNPFRTQTLADFTIDPDYSTPAHIREYKAVSTSAGVEGLRTVKVNSIQALKDRFKHAACTPYMPVGKGTLDEMIMYLCAGEWFMKWRWSHRSEPKKYQRRYFWLDGEDCALMWAISDSIISFSKLKLRSVEKMVSDCVSVNGKVIFRMQLYGEKMLVFGTEHRLLFDQWFSVLRYIISPNNGHGVPGLWQRPSNSTVTRVGRWASRYSPLQAELLTDMQVKKQKSTAWTD